MNKKENQKLQELLDDMIKKFQYEFLQKHLASVSIGSEVITLNLLFSFAVSSFLNITMPLLTSTVNKDKAIADAEKLLNDLRIAMMTGIKGHTPIGKIIV